MNTSRSENSLVVNPRDAWEVLLVARSPFSGGETPPVAVLIEPASELTWLPAGVLAAAGFTPTRHRDFGTANGDVIRRPVAYAIVQAQGFETVDEVVFAQPGDPCVLGERTLAGFGVALHAETRQFRPTPTLAHLHERAPEGGAS